MTSEELKKLIKTGENGVVEFKRGRGGVPGDFWPSYSAFANTDGGGKKTSTKSAKTSTGQDDSPRRRAQVRQLGSADINPIMTLLREQFANDAEQMDVVIRRPPKFLGSKDALPE